MSKVEEIIDYYIAWEEVAERVEYKKSTPFEKEQIRLKYDEDAKYFKNLGYDDNTALHADVIVSFWTIYKTLLNNEAHWKVSKTLKSLEALRRQIQSKGRYSKKILEVNEMISEFAEICYTRGNYMLLPEGARGMNNQRYLFTEDTASGMGLIKCGSVVIPFDNKISKDTDLYKLYNTNIHEIIEMKKHANEKC